MSWPTIDHSFISPNGHISERAKKEYVSKFADELFGNRSCFEVKVKQPTERERLLRQAEELRTLASRGMKPRAYLKKAEELENRAKAL